MIIRVIGDAMSGIERAGMQWDSWEDDLLTRSNDCADIALMIMRPEDEVVKRKRQLAHPQKKNTGASVRTCRRCDHHGITGTCGIEIEGLSRANESWTRTRVYKQSHRCHLGLLV